MGKGKHKAVVGEGSMKESKSKSEESKGKAKVKGCCTIYFPINASLYKVVLKGPIQQLIKEVAKISSPKFKIPVLNKKIECAECVILKMTGKFDQQKRFCSLLVLKHNLYIIGFANQKGKWYSLSGQEEYKEIFETFKMEPSYISSGYTGLKTESHLEIEHVGLGTNALSFAVQLLAKFEVNDSDKQSSNQAIFIVCLMLAEATRFKWIRKFISEKDFDVKGAEFKKWINNYLTECKEEEKLRRQKKYGVQFCDKEYCFERLIHKWDKISEYYLAEDTAEIPYYLVPHKAMGVIKNN